MTIRTQTKSPGTVVSDDAVGTIAWSDPEGAKSEGGDAANATGPGTTEYLLADTYGFDLLPTAVPLTALLGARRHAGGLAWTDRKTAAGSGSTNMQDCAIGPDGEMLAVGLSGYIRTSTNGGANWTNRKTAAGASTTTLIACAIGPDGEMLAVGFGGYIRTSTNGGATWTDRNTAAGAGSTGSLRGCAIGPSGEMLAVGGSGYIRTSTDGGANWTDRKTAAGSGSTQLQACAIGPDGEMIAVGFSGYIRTSTNGGANWTNRKTAAGSGSTILQGCAIGPDGEMLAVGFGGYIRTSTNGGATWTDRNTAAGAGSTALNGCAIGPSGEMLIVGASGFIRTSTDGGANWTDRSTAAGTGSTDMHGCAIGPSGEMAVVGFRGYIRTAVNLTATDSDARLIVGGSVSGDNLSESAVWASEYQTDTFGPVSITALTPAQVNGSGFGWRLSAAMAGAGLANVDHMWITTAYDIAVDCAFTSPVDEGTLDRPNATIEWDAEVGGSAITQNNFRVRIYSLPELTLVYDSGVKVSATQEHEIGDNPTLAWSSPQNESEYRIRVDVTEDGSADPDGEGDPITGFVEIDITTDWTPPDAVTGFTVTPVTEV